MPKPNPAAGNRSIQALRFITEADGLSNTVRQMASVCAIIAQKMIESKTTEKYNAPKWLRAAESIEELANKIQDELKI